MDFYFQELPAAAKVFIAVITALGTLLAFWPKFSLSKGESSSVAILAVVIGALIWPIDDSYCLFIPRYRNQAGIFLLGFLVSGVIAIAITRQFEHTQPDLGDVSDSSKPVLGGPILAPQAEELRVRLPHATTQQIFERLKYDKRAMWEKWPRSVVVISQRFFANFSVLLLLLSIVCSMAYLVLVNQTGRTHQVLTLSPLTVDSLLPRRSVEFKTKYKECRMGIQWNIQASTVDRAAGQLGEIDNGIYFAPASINREMEIYVVARPLQHPEDEFQRAKITLRPHPVYSEQHEASGTDSTGREARFLIEVVDTRYSWVIGENRLTGVNGAMLVRQMAADGIFGGFKDIIAIGAASREVGKDGFTGEDQRASERADLLGRWVRAAISANDVSVHGLKIGRYDETATLTSEETARERQVVIVGVLQADPGVDLLSALRDAFAQERSNQPFLDMYVKKYPVEHWELRSIPHSVN